jgi:uncharacterized protein
VKNHFAIVLMACLVLLAPLRAQASTFPDEPFEGRYYVDEAGLIDQAAGAQIDKTAAALLADDGIPLYVVTIPSLAKHDAARMGIERYATALFNGWGIGWEQHNYGILLLISRDDRKARIELGADWGRDHDAQAGQVMDKLIIPAFKHGDFATGIADGVRGLDAMARGLPPPTANTPGWAGPALVGGLVLLVIMIIKLARRGRFGWAGVSSAAFGAIAYGEGGTLSHALLMPNISWGPWLAWIGGTILIGLISVFFYFIRRMFDIGSDDDGSDGSSGGCGGGFSDGGGDTGSW